MEQLMNRHESPLNDPVSEKNARITDDGDWAISYRMHSKTHYDEAVWCKHTNIVNFQDRVKPVRRAGEEPWPPGEPWWDYTRVDFQLSLDELIGLAERLKAIREHEEIS